MKIRDTFGECKEIFSLWILEQIYLIVQEVLVLLTIFFKIKDWACVKTNLLRVLNCYFIMILNDLYVSFDARS